MTASFAPWNAEHDAEAEAARREDEYRFERLLSEASPTVRGWCEYFVNGGTATAAPTLNERAGWLLSRLAPSRVHHSSSDDDDLDNDDDLATGGGA